MHIVNYVQFFITFGLSITVTTLTSRLIGLLLRRRGLGIESAAYANGASLVICWMFFVFACSTTGKIYWFAGHIAFVPQVAWFIFDILRFEEADQNEDDCSISGVP